MHLRLWHWGFGSSPMILWITSELRMLSNNCWDHPLIFEEFVLNVRCIFACTVDCSPQRTRWQNPGSEALKVGGLPCMRRLPVHAGRLAVKEEEVCSPPAVISFSIHLEKTSLQTGMKIMMDTRFIVSETNQCVSGSAIRRLTSWSSNQWMAMNAWKC